MEPEQILACPRCTAKQRPAETCRYCGINLATWQAPVPTRPMAPLRAPLPSAPRTPVRGPGLQKPAARRAEAEDAGPWRRVFEGLALVAILAMLGASSILRVELTPRAWIIATASAIVALCAVPLSLALFRRRANGTPRNWPLLTFSFAVVMALYGMAFFGAWRR